MTRSDELMLAAIRMKTSMKMNGREVTTAGDISTITLHGFPAVAVRVAENVVRVCGAVLVSRKSAKVINIILDTYTDCHIRGVNGCWVLENRKGDEVPIGKNIVTIPITKEDRNIKEIETYVESK